MPPRKPQLSPEREGGGLAKEGSVEGTGATSVRLSWSPAGRAAGQSGNGRPVWTANGTRSTVDAAGGGGWRRARPADRVSFHISRVEAVRAWGGPPDTPAGPGGATRATGLGSARELGVIHPRASARPATNGRCGRAGWVDRPRVPPF